MEIRKYQDIDLIQHKINKDNGNTYWSYEEIFDHKNANRETQGGGNF